MQKRPRKISSEDRKAIVKLLKKHKNLTKVAEISGKDPGTVGKVRTENNIKVFKQHTTSDEKEKILALLKEGKSTRKIAEIMDKGKSTISNIAKANNFDFKTRTFPESS